MVQPNNSARRSLIITTKQLIVDMQYDEVAKLITVTFEEDDQLITVGFNIHEAQAFNIKLNDTIIEAILGISTPAKTKH